MTLTEHQNRIIHAFVKPGGCWHEMIPAFPCPDVTDYKFRGHKCKKCGFYWSTKIEDGYGTPTYTNDAPFSNFLRVLFEEERIWFVFRYYSVCRWMQEDTQLYYDNGEARFERWLFSDRERFLTLFLEFLALPETQRDWGWEECPECSGRGELSYKRDGLSDLATYQCAECNGSGQVPRKWLKVWREGKDVR